MLLPSHYSKWWRFSVKSTTNECTITVIHTIQNTLLKFILVLYLLKINIILIHVVHQLRNRQSVICNYCTAVVHCNLKPRDIFLWAVGTEENCESNMNLLSIANTTVCMHVQSTRCVITALKMTMAKSCRQNYRNFYHSVDSAQRSLSSSICAYASYNTAAGGGVSNDYDWKRKPRRNKTQGPSTTVLRDPVRQVFISQSNDIFTNLALEDWLYRHHDFDHKVCILVLVLPLTWTGDSAEAADRRLPASASEISKRMGTGGNVPIFSCIRSAT